METRRLRKGILTFLVVFQLCALQAQEGIEIGIKYWNEIKDLKEAVFKKQGDSKFCGDFQFENSHLKLKRIASNLDDLKERKQHKRIRRYNKLLYEFIDYSNMEYNGLKNEFHSIRKNRDSTVIRLTKIDLYLDQLSTQSKRVKALIENKETEIAVLRMQRISSSIRLELETFKN